MELAVSRGVRVTFCSVRTGGPVPGELEDLAKREIEVV
jgi:hypothetical protein